MIKLAISGLFIIVSFLLQCSVFPHFSFGGIIPNLMIIVTSSYGFMRGKKDGLIVGFFSGLFMDIFFCDVIGYYALIYMYIGYFNGIFRRLFYPEDIKLPLVLIIGSDFLYNLVSYILGFLLKGRFQVGYYFLNICIPEIVYTVVVTCVLYPILLFVEKRLDRQDKEGVAE